jgi:MFS family permease
MTISTDAAIPAEADIISAAADVQAGARAPSLFYPWLVVAFLMLVYTSSFIDRTILSLLVQPIRADLHLSDSEYSYLGGLAFVVLYSLSSVPLGSLVDRSSRRAIIAVGVATWSIMTAGCGIATSFWRLFAFRVGVGIGEATLSPATYSLVGDLFPREKLGRALSLFGLGSQIGAGLALLVGGSVIAAMVAVGPIDLPVLGTTKPWQVVFLAIGLPGLILAALTMVIVREPRRARAPGLQEDRAGWGPTLAYMWTNWRIYTALFIGMGFIAMFGYGSNFWYPAFLQRIHGFSIPEAGRFWGLSQLILGILGALTAGTMADRLISRGRLDGHFRVCILFGIGNAICGVGTGLAPWPWLSLAFVAATGFVSNTIIGAIAAGIQMVTPARMRGKVSALYIMSAAFIGLAFGPSAIANATDHIFGYDNAIGYSIALVAAVFPLLGCLLLNMGRKPVLALLAP